jgi:hypothetical protein
MSRTTSYLRPIVLILWAALAAVALAAASPAATAADGNCQPSGDKVVCTFDTPGTWSWTVPAGVTQATFEVFGAQGGRGGETDGGQGGLGGEAKATFFDLQPNSKLQVNVGGAGQAGGDTNGAGQGGLNGGGDGGGSYGPGGGGGAGASDVRFDTDSSGDFALAERIIVAGGGGGGGGAKYCLFYDQSGSSLFFSSGPGSSGGSGGGTTGNPGEGEGGGGGGTESAGGAGGSGYYSGNDGALGIGGWGADTSGSGNPCTVYGGVGGGGGGGGGYYGGGGGSSVGEFEQRGGAGGGGGSGFVSPEGANPVLQPEVRSGAGKVTITYTPPDTDPPTVKDTIPQAGATGVSRTTTVKANFSEPVQAATLTSNTVQLFSGNSTKAIKATLSKTPTSVTLTPSQKLDAKTRYTAKIKGGATGVKDLAGNPLASDFSWSFTTGSM